MYDKVLLRFRIKKSVLSKFRGTDIKKELFLDQSSIA